MGVCNDARRRWNGTHQVIQQEKTGSEWKCDSLGGQTRRSVTNTRLKGIEISVHTSCGPRLPGMALAKRLHAAHCTRGGLASVCTHSGGTSSSEGAQAITRNDYGHNQQSSHSPAPAHGRLPPACAARRIHTLLTPIPRLDAYPDCPLRSTCRSSNALFQSCILLLSHNCQVRPTPALILAYLRLPDSLTPTPPPASSSLPLSVHTLTLLPPPPCLSLLLLPKSSILCRAGELSYGERELTESVLGGCFEPAEQLDSPASLRPPDSFPEPLVLFRPPW